MGDLDFTAQPTPQPQQTTIETLPQNGNQQGQNNNNGALGFNALYGQTQQQQNVSAPVQNLTQNQQGQGLGGLYGQTYPYQQMQGQGYPQQPGYPAQPFPQSYPQAYPQPFPQQYPQQYPSPYPAPPSAYPQQNFQGVNQMFTVPSQQGVYGNVSMAQGVGQQGVGQISLSSNVQQNTQNTTTD